MRANNNVYSSAVNLVQSTGVMKMPSRIWDSCALWLNTSGNPSLSTKGSQHPDYPYLLKQFTWMFDFSAIAAYIVPG